LSSIYTQPTNQPTNHQELRLLCLEPAEALPASRLLERYHETLSSMVRYELKKVR
jgi:hypothetical protein